MAAVRSLGLHKPTGLSYLIQEHLLPSDPSPDTYEWEELRGDSFDSLEDDELLSTRNCVVWSTGGVVRKSFRFDLENEPVTKALLTCFPSDENDLRTDTNNGSHETGVGHREALGTGSRTSKSRTTSKALVVFLRTQAHIYFLSGTSHVIHLPFEVDCALAAPNGIIVQRRLNLDSLASASMNYPQVPNNTFSISQTQPWSGTSSIQSTFSTAGLGNPKTLNFPNGPILSTWQTSMAKDDSNWPRLFSLTDPLAEMGLVVTGSKAHGKRRVSTKLFALDPVEEILHITDLKDFSSIQGAEQKPLILAVTLNRVNSIFTVWRVEYVEQEDMGRPRRNFSRSAPSRRRSSFNPGVVTGSTTPAVNGQLMFRESIGGPGGNKGLGFEDSLAGEILDLATALDPDFDDKSLPRRKSRRVSSMLARADLSASHERNAFSEFATNGSQPSKRRGESLGLQGNRVSLGRPAANGNTQTSHFGNSINSLLEAPVEDLLDELRAGGDFEGFHNMGLDDEDFEGLRKEIIFSKIESVPMQQSNVRYSIQNKPAKDQCSVFSLVAPRVASEDPRRREIVVCILDKPEKSLIVITLDTKARLDDGQIPRHGRTGRREKDSILVMPGNVKRAKRVLDARRLTDGDISRMLILTETSDGFGELTLQAPWSHIMRLELPLQLAINDTRSIGHNATPQKRREGSLKRVLSDGIRAITALRSPTSRGRFDIVDEKSQIHHMCVHLEPRLPAVKSIMNVCRSVLPGPRNGEGLLVAWWNVQRWFIESENEQAQDEWTALVVVLLSLMLSLQDSQGNRPNPSNEKKHRSHTRSGSHSQADNENWHEMMASEASLTSGNSLWLDTDAWGWLDDEGASNGSWQAPKTSGTKSSSNLSERDLPNNDLQRQVELARAFVASDRGQAALGGSSERLGYLPTARYRSLEARQNAITDLLTGLHLFREEQKLSVATADSLVSGSATLGPVLAQMFRWVGWTSWTRVYDAEDATMPIVKFDTNTIVVLSEPANPPDVYQWIESSFVSKRLGSYVTIADITMSRSVIGHEHAKHTEQWTSLTPRTSLFTRYFSTITPRSTAPEMIEALHTAGLTSQIIETLPEAVLVPLKESIVSCQNQPSASWSRELLILIDREDVTLLLSPDAYRPKVFNSILAPTHAASADVHTICSSTQDVEPLGSFDGSAEVDRQAITRLIFKDDRRFSEAADILNTTKATVARVAAQPEWSESDLLEAQKEHVQMLATRTLAVPTGRGLLYFSARVPLLTEKFPIGGFNLHCVMKPTNNTVGVEKMNFTEEKVCWAFFHSGVSAGLSISRAAKGIDTSWILYNKPAELSNRHAGFLLALGLNGHLKSVAKWVAFKYLTPKHTMTSIGLLLGLAASYLGTMDSLITRLLSVHVTRMLPPGAAELNLSPLTQTSGIMGIGLLYYKTQHRRMSEIMLSEVEHIEPELEDEPLRNEGYRLASGFALGFINLGKGSDLKGLHDMHVTERLLKMAVGSKKVDLVHILDKSTSAAIIAIALIFMKSGNQSLARKIDVPDSVLQYAYVRPDMFLLRTMARHLIMWDEIKATATFIRDMLPEHLRERGTLASVDDLKSSDLPFYNILTGLLFSIALRHAGSGSLQVRDLLLHYLDHMSRICKLPATNFDQKLARTTVRNCLDLVALSVSTAMAGTGDLPTFRRLRALHGRDDAETPYGSHLAAHIAIGALFLGGGTHTFGTSDLATGSLIISFYPLFPTTILDNKSHLQAFRHFWVLATEARCLIARDIDTNRPVAVPMSITLKSGAKTPLHSPCLLPQLDLIKTVSTTSTEYWNIILDFGADPRVHNSFHNNQTVWVRRKQAADATASVFQATIQALSSNSFSSQFPSSSSQPLSWLFTLPAFSGLSKAERTLVLGSNDGSASTGLGTESTVVDTRLVLERASFLSGKRDRLLGLKLLFAWKKAQEARGEKAMWLRGSAIDGLKAEVSLMGQG